MQTEPESKNKKTELASGELLIITGLSGAGKSTALTVFEDLGYFTVDGLPAALAPDMSQLMEKEPMRHFKGMALGMDLRQESFLDEYAKTLEDLADSCKNLRVIFLEANNNALLRRYAATRRPHPLERSGFTLDSALQEEKRLLAPIREKADIIIDSSNFSIHDLRRDLQRKVLREGNSSSSMRVILISFGFKYGLPTDADFIFDLRFLDNPYFIERLRPLSGKDKAVVDYIFSQQNAQTFKQLLLDLLQFALSAMADEGRYRVTIGFGCTGGRHRSVAMTEAVATALHGQGFPISIEHRNLDRDLVT